MADYTDGAGWAKLDTTAACHLADCMDMFQGRAASKRRKMLLFCYSKLNGAKIPFFRLGRGAIAKACGVSDEVAKKFIEFCCDNEIFVEFEETEKGFLKGWVFKEPPLGSKPLLLDPTTWVKNIGLRTTIRRRYIRVGRKALKATFPPPLPLSPLTLRRKRVR